MNYNSFINDSGITVRKSYYDSAIVPMYEQSGKSEQDFCKDFPEIIAEISGAHIIEVTDIKKKIVSDDFYQLHNCKGHKCTFIELINSCDDTIG